MGHYAAEMMCDRCGNCRCTCPPEKDKTLEQWVVDEDYAVLKAKDFEAKHGFMTVGRSRVPHAAMGRIRRLGLEHFSTKALAEAAALSQLREALEASIERTERLRARLQELSSFDRL